MRLESSVSELNVYRLDDWGLILIQIIDFSICHYAQINTGIHLPL
jgi:hypothetical protein